MAVSVAQMPQQGLMLYAVRKSESLASPAIFCDWDDCAPFVDDRVHNDVEYKCFDDVLDAFNYICANKRGESEEVTGTTHQESRKPSSTQSHRSSKRPRRTESTQDADRSDEEWTPKQKKQRVNDKQKKESRHDVRFKQMVQALKAYQEKYGHFNVPLNDADNKELGQWIRAINKSYREYLRGNSRSSFTPERVQALTSIGFTFDTSYKKPAEENLHNINWNTRLEELKAFKEQYGHCNVPTNYPENAKLSVWVGTQRSQHKFLRSGKRSNLTPDRIQALNSIGFAWNTQKTEVLKWEDRFAQIVVYKEQQGHTNVPQKGDKFSPDGLGTWVCEQRRLYKIFMKGSNGNGRLTQDKIDQLESIGFVWQLRNRGKSQQQQQQNTYQHGDYE